MPIIYIRVILFFTKTKILTNESNLDMNFTIKET
jgi:hypothetical protein